MSVRAWAPAMLLAMSWMEPAAAAATDAASVVAAVEQRYHDVEAIRAAFTQTTHNEVFGAETQQGTVVLKRPSKMRWEFTSGDARSFVTDGEKMWVYSKADNQVIRYDNMAAASSAADSLLQSLDSLDEQFAVVLVEGKPESITLDLTPRKEGMQVKQLRLVLDKSYLLEELMLVDPYDNRTEIAFRDVELNAAAQDSLFQFEVPEGVEVITADSL